MILDDETIDQLAKFYLSLGATRDGVRKALAVAIMTADAEAFDDGYCPARNAAYLKAFGESTFLGNRGYPIYWSAIGADALEKLGVLMMEELRP